MRTSSSRIPALDLRVLACSLSLLACLTSTAHATPAEARNVAELLERARAQQTKDLDSWSVYSFDRRVVRQRLDRRDQVYWQETLLFRVEPTDNGSRSFRELLLAVDGHEPSDRQARSHLEAGRFDERYNELLRGDPEDVQSGYSLPALLRMSSYRYSGLEEKHGHSCHRLDFEPGPPKPGGIARKIADVSAGTLWLSESGWHLVAAEAATSQRVSLALGLARIQHLQVVYEGAPINANTWLPRRIEVRTELQLLGRRQRKRNVFTYGRFESTGLERPVSAPSR